LLGEDKVVSPSA